MVSLYLFSVNIPTAISLIYNIQSQSAEAEPYHQGQDTHFHFRSSLLADDANSISRQIKNACNEYFQSN